MFNCKGKYLKCDLADNFFVNIVNLMWVIIKVRKNGKNIKYLNHKLRLGVYK